MMSNYHLSILITGSTQEKRYEHTQHIAAEHHIHTSDRIEIIGTTNIGIEAIRNWVKRLSYKPISSTQKIGIIHPGELMSIEAQQALLKTIEEPPVETMIAITIPFLGAVLPTIQSRCIELSLGNTDDSNQSDALLTEVLGANQSKRLALAEVHGTADQADTYIKNLRIALQRTLMMQYKNSSYDLSTLLPIYPHLDTAEQALKANVHPRLVIENLLLSLPG